jgi:TonB-linked SusC/RagA family outer membrane protein
MAPSAQQLQGAVVTALAIRREKRDIGYSATTLNSDELNNANVINPLSSLQGKVSGANITSTTGGPGGSTRVVLRGEKSITGNNNALIVVDGVPINNDNRLVGQSNLEQIDFGNRGNDINPEDIESVTVLKGPAAAALYGSQAANGAIMITTKSGGKRQGKKKAEISYSTNYTISNVLKYPEFQHQYGEGDLHGVPNDRRENFSWGLPFDGQLRPWGQVINGQQLVKPYKDQPDNVKSFFRNGKSWENSLSLAGGNGETSSYYIGLNTLNSTQVTPGTFYDKYSLRFNGSTQLSNKFYSSIHLNYISIKARVEAQGQGDNSVWSNLLQTPRDIPVWELARYDEDPFYGYGFKDENNVSRYGYYGNYTLNPYWVADHFDNRSRSDRVLGSVVVGYKANDEFNIYDRIGGDFTGDRFTAKWLKYSYLPFEEGLYDAITGAGGYLERNTNTNNVYNDLIANYDKELNDNLTLHVLLGNNMQYNRINDLSGFIDPATNGLTIPGYYNLTNGEGPVEANNSMTESFLIGVYGSVRLDFDRQLFLEATARNDWSSTLVRKHNTSNISFFYPSVNASWVFTEALKNDNIKDIISYGKLRAGYASVGNGAQAYANREPGFVSAVSNTGFGSVRFPFLGTPGFTYEGTIADPNLKPELTNSWEIGAELEFLNNRIGLEATYYSSRSVNQIVPLPIAPSSGYTSYITNVGTISNKGVELSLRATPVSTATGFRWEIFGTYTKNVNRVESLTGGVDQVTIGGHSSMAIVARVGEPYGEFYGVDFERDPQGNVVVDPLSGLPKTAANPALLGSYQPDFIASWGTSLKYKGFSLNVLFDTKQGGKFYSGTKRIMDFVGVSPETAENDRNPYIYPNSVIDNGDGTYSPNTTVKTDPYDYYTTLLQTTESPHILDASYVKLREASLYYTIPDSWLKKTPFGTGSVGIFGNNLLIWTAKENVYVDPEANSGGATNVQGYEYMARPSLRNYGISLKVTF